MFQDMDYFQLPNGKYRLVWTCPVCHAMNHLDFDKEIGNNIAEYLSGHRTQLIQDALPEASTEVREVLISGLCLACQEMIFGKD